MVLALATVAAAADSGDSERVHGALGGWLSSSPHQLVHQRPGCNFQLRTPVKVAGDIADPDSLPAISDRHEPAVSTLSADSVGSEGTRRSQSDQPYAGLRHAPFGPFSKWRHGFESRCGSLVSLLSNPAFQAALQDLLGTRERTFDYDMRAQ
jgi:hypothetical protein